MRQRYLIKSEENYKNSLNRQTHSQIRSHKSACVILYCVQCTLGLVAILLLDVLCVIENNFLMLFITLRNNPQYVSHIDMYKHCLFTFDAPILAAYTQYAYLFFGVHLQLRIHNMLIQFLVSTSDCVYTIRLFSFWCPPLTACLS